MSEAKAAAGDELSPTGIDLILDRLCAASSDGPVRHEQYVCIPDERTPELAPNER